jgi:hypothetical protein
MRNCRSNYSNCLETCDPSKPYMYNSQCNAPADLPPGVGADPSTFEVKACAIPNCTRCQEDYLQCQGCNSTPLPAYYLYNGGCYLPASLPTGIGANFSSGLTGPCIDSNCKECKYDLTKCSQCHGPTDPQYFLDTTNSLCILSSNIPVGFGASYLNYMMTPCNGIGCLYCQSNYFRCTSCKNLFPNQQRYLYGDS